MPVMKCSNNKYKIGKKGKCMYSTKTKADKAYKGYLASTHINENDDLNTEIQQWLDVGVVDPNEIAKKVNSTDIENIKKIINYLVDNEMILENSHDPIDTITMDVPLMIRLFEWAKEDCKDDAHLHEIAQNIISVSKESAILSMQHYKDIITNEDSEQSEILQRASYLNTKR